jgi:ABC-type sugar transport system ATPase subunit
MAMADKIAVMDRGQLLQYDIPTTVYYKPATTFVAGFVGSPAMNLIKTTIMEENSGGLTLDGTEFKYSLPDNLVDFVKGKTSTKEVYLGIRPEDLRLSIEKDMHSVFECDVYVVEPLGPQNVVDLKVGGSLVKAVTAPTLRLDIGQEVWAGVDSTRIHIFDSNGQLLV